MDTIHRGINVLKETYLDLDFTPGGYFYNEAQKSVKSTKKTVEETDAYDKNK